MIQQKYEQATVRSPPEPEGFRLDPSVIQRPNEDTDKTIAAVEALDLPSRQKTLILNAIAATRLHLIVCLHFASCDAANTISPLVNPNAALQFEKMLSVESKVEEEDVSE